ncbi:MAG TPA: tetratricopeptide repeat protein [Ferruginibacter sp.]|jgi:tetratricopeptide (TPR) repeat protein|nr:tetratricopeptide repeat protein [Ferruginibacter sp.]
MKHFITILLTLCAFFAVAQKPNKYDKIVDSFQRAGKTEKLIPFFQKELKAAPNNENVLRWLGYLYIQNKQLDLGKKYYTDALAIDPACGNCYANIGMAYSMKSDYNKALECYNKGLAMDPGNAMLYAQRGQLKAFLGDRSNASADMDEAIELAPKAAEYYIQRGKFNESMGYSSLAIFDFNKAVELAPDNYDAYFERADHYFNKQMTQEALQDINMAISLDSNQEKLYLGRAAIYASLTERDLAMADYAKAVKLNPKDYGAYYNRSFVDYTLEDMDGYCVDLYTAYDTLKKYGPTDSLKNNLEYSIDIYCDSGKASYYYQRGVAFYNLQQYDKAIRIYTAGLKKFPKNSMMLCFRGNAYFTAKDYTQALSDYTASFNNKENVVDDYKLNQKHTGWDPTTLDKQIALFFATAQLSIAQSKFALGDYDSALVAINTALTLAPDLKDFTTEDFYNVRGDILMALGKYQQALDDYNKAIEINFSFYQAYVNRAVAKVDIANNITVRSYFVSGGTNDQSFNANWTLPVKSSIKKSDANMASALADCNKAIVIDPKSGYGYYIRGQIKKLLLSDYCNDIQIAKDLNYPVDPELLKGCGK